MFTPTTLQCMYHMAMAATTTFASSCLLVLGTVLIAAVAQSLSEDCVGGEGGGVSFGGSISLGFDLYRSSCPEAEDIIFSGVERAVAADPRMAASLLRLHFHDCFVNGCDASVLLDDTPDTVGEKTAAPNLNSLRGFDVVDSIKADLEAACPETVSCADILAVAARDSVVLSGGPTWQVEMGREDGLTANNKAANSNIPGPTSDVVTLTRKFQDLGLSQKDMVVLSGAHTIGKARCATFSQGLAGSRGGDRVFLSSLQQLCSSGSNSTLAHLDLSTPATFDNQYYVNLISGEGLLPSDQVLVGGSDGAGTVGSLVEGYASDTISFFEDFKESMKMMGRLSPPAGSGGEVRRCCRVVN